MAEDTNTLSYWLNWRFFLCALWILAAMGLASFLIWRYEEFRKSRNERRERQRRRETAGSLYEGEAWNTCLKGIHPSWLLIYRIVSFLVLLILLIVNVIVDGGGLSLWSPFTLGSYLLKVSSDLCYHFLFQLASCFSIYGCCFNHNKLEVNTADSEQGTYSAPILDGAVERNLIKNSHTDQEPHTWNPAGAWGYMFQIIFQTSAGAVMLTDLVFWLVIYPFMTAADFRLHFFDVCMHSVNALFLLGDTALNCMRFPMFRFAYFILWTGIFVIFQWIIHACVSLWWPYPFLDLSSPYAPLWYFAVGVMHIPCYGAFALVVRLKHLWLSRTFPETCQFIR
ncbi:hypothetical protein Ahy_B05g078368 isoform D [Arachis hypogaea]|uniref:Uncharacterized protein n=1 Tax=Arachis hypogaea TaxID=3818 RepID=A0A444Z712_ARAHY|nr:hypothetical protein Ahy_B05g078368 isoform D [Arachis hypogaea]